MDEDDDIPTKIDFSKGIRNPHAERYAKGDRVRIVDEHGNVLEKESREAEEAIANTKK